MNRYRASLSERGLFMGLELSPRGDLCYWEDARQLQLELEQARRLLAHWRTHGGGASRLLVEQTDEQLRKLFVAAAPAAGCSHVFRGTGRCVRCGEPDAAVQARAYTDALRLLAEQAQEIAQMRAQLKGLLRDKTMGAGDMEDAIEAILSPLEAFGSSGCPECGKRHPVDRDHAFACSRRQARCNDCGGALAHRGEERACPHCDPGVVAAWHQQLEGKQDA